MSPYQLSETPGIFYAIAYWMSTLLFVLLTKTEKLTKKKIGRVFVFLLILYLHMEIINSDVSQVYFIPIIIISALIMFLFLFTTAEIPWKNALYFTARAFIVGEFAASLTYQIYYFLVLDFKVSFDYIGTYAFIFWGCSMLLGLLYKLEKRFVIESAEQVITYREIASVMIIVIVVFTMSNISYVYQNTPFSGSMARDIFNIRTMVDFGGVALLFAYHVQLNEMKQKFEVQKLESLLKNQMINYQTSERSIEIINQKYHDLKHLINILKNDPLSQETQDYLAVMEKEINSYDLRMDTGNSGLDIVLTGKQIFCQKEKITFTVIADGASLSFMNSVDISTLFGNIIDNAIESVRKITKEDNRLIQLKISRKGEMLLICLENRYEEPLTFENGLPITTKKDKHFHGYGLKSVRETVNKYKGTMVIQTEDGWFELKLLFPVKHSMPKRG